MAHFTTLGYWWFDEPQNKGTLNIEVVKLSDWRFEAAVWGHELIEILYCKIVGVTTEQADEFDAMYERGYANGSIPKSREPGHDPKCCYHWGHMMGVAWEHICVYGTFASWSRYLAECDKLMGIEQPL
jgi:hypothetical protein